MTFLVGGSFGEMRLLALDALGRTLAYGAGRGDTVALGLCPGSQFAVEAVHDGEEGFLAVRDLRTFEVVRELVVGRGGSPRLHAVACLDREGRRTLAIDGSDEDTSRIWVANADRTELVFEGRVWEARLQGGRALVVLPDGDLLAFDADARRTNLGHLPPRMSHVTLSPDGSMAAGILYGGSLSGEPPTEVVLVGLPEGPVLRSSLEGWNDSGHVAWLDDQRLVYLPGGADDDRARVFDIAMREIAGFDDWYTSEATVVGDTVYGIGWGELVAAELPRGPVIVLQRFESPETFAFAYVSGGPKVGNFASPARAEHEGLAAPGPSDMDERADSSRWMPVWLLPAGGLVLAAVLLRRRPRRQR